MYTTDNSDSAQFGLHRDSPRVLSVLSSLLEHIVTQNDRFVAQFEQSGVVPPLCRVTVFHGQRPPSISIEKYVERIFKYANCSPSCFVVAYAYLDRFVHNQSGLPITSLNVHRLLITSVMVAAKFLDDSYYNNAYYAKVGGVSTSEMNRLELEFLFRLGFRLQVTVEVFDRYCTHLEREVAAAYGHVKVEKSIMMAMADLNKHRAGIKGVMAIDNPMDTAQEQSVNVDTTQQQTQGSGYAPINVLESVS